MKFLIAAGVVILFSLPLAVHAAATQSTEVKLLNLDGSTRRTFTAMPASYTGGVSVAAGDLGVDQEAEVVVGGGFGVPPDVTIFRQDGSKITSFLAYAPQFGRGVRVAVGDVDGDGQNEIITAPAYGGGPHIRIFDGMGTLESEFFAYDPAFRGGVFIAVRDVTNDGIAEIITGAGPTGGPHVRIFDATGTVKSEFFAFDASDASGVTVGTADTNGNGVMEIIVGRASSDPPEVKIFTTEGYLVSSFLAYEPTFTDGLAVHGADTDADGRDEIIVAPNGGREPIHIFEPNGTLETSITPFEPNFEGSVSLTVARLNGSPEQSFIVAPARAIREGNIAYEKSIVVDISEQRLYAFERGLLVESYLVSTGLPRFPTPTGEFSVLAKVPIVNYTWSYGPNHPDNYSLPNVPWNLRFKPHFYIHYAYWHNDFGRQRSHGCVNLPLEPAKWVYGWANEGTPITIRE